MGEGRGEGWRVRGASFFTPQRCYHTGVTQPRISLNEPEDRANRAAAESTALNVHSRAGLPALPYKWSVVFLLWFVCFFNYADRQAISSVLPVLGKSFGFDPVQLGWIGSSFAWVYGGLAWAAGLIADRIVRKRLIVAACIVWSFFTLATAWCGSLSMFVVVRALTGLGETFYFPAAMSLISDYHGPQTRSRAMAWHQSAVYAGTILGSWLAALLAERHGWQTPFFLFGPMGFVLAIVLMKWLREPERSEQSKVPPSSDSGAASQSPKSKVLQGAAVRMANVEQTEPPTLDTRHSTLIAALLMAGFLCANFVAVIFLTWAPTFLFEKFHYSLGVAGLNATLYIQLASAVAVPTAGWLADRWVRRWAFGRMLAQVLGLLLGAIFVYMVGRTNNSSTLLLAMTCFGLCKGFYDSGIFASLYDVVQPRARGTAAGLMNTIGWGGAALGPVFVGYFAKHGDASTTENMGQAIAYGAFFYLAAAACLIAAMVIFAHARRDSVDNA